MRKYYFSLKNNLHRLAFASLLFTFSQLNAQVGIGTTTPKAMLDIHMSDPVVNGVTGFLVPRVNTLYTGTDVEPGLMVFYTGTEAGMQNTFYVYNENYGWQTIMNAGLPQVGDYDSVNDGVVFWVNPDDPTNYKIVSLVDLDYDGDYTRDWGPYNDEVSGCESSTDGHQNTLDWIDEYGNNSNRIDEAPYLCYTYKGSYQSPAGWYMGARSEWDDLYDNREIVQAKLNSLNNADQIYAGEDDEDEYWTSEEKDKKEVYRYKFNDGSDSAEKKYESKRIRAFKEIGG